MNTRRDFLQGTICATAGAVITGCATVAKDGVDPNLTVFLSDIHIVEDNPVYLKAFDYTKRELGKRVAEVLAMRPLPSRVVTLGDLCFNHGERSSYAFTVPLFRRLEAAGIKVVHGMGNHDRRNTFLDAYPEYAKTTKVPGRIVSVVDLGTADLILLDSLKGKDGEVQGPVEGALDDAQQEWLASVLPGWKRPVFVGAHHPANELHVCGKRMVTFLKECPKVAGWFNGHDHIWRKECLVGWWAKNEDSIRSLTFPSAGLWGDIGSVAFRTGADHALAVLSQSDYWFNSAPYPGEPTPELWREIVLENRGQYCKFPYERLMRAKWNERA